MDTETVEPSKLNKCYVYPNTSANTEHSEVEDSCKLSPMSSQDVSPVSSYTESLRKSRFESILGEPDEVPQSSKMINPCRSPFNKDIQRYLDIRKFWLPYRSDEKVIEIPGDKSGSDDTLSISFNIESSQSSDDITTSSDVQNMYSSKKSYETNLPLKEDYEIELPGDKSSPDNTTSIAFNLESSSMQPPDDIATSSDIEKSYSFEKLTEAILPLKEANYEIELPGAKSSLDDTTLFFNLESSTKQPLDDITTSSDKQKIYSSEKSNEANLPVKEDDKQDGRIIASDFTAALCDCNVCINIPFLCTSSISKEKKLTFHEFPQKMYLSLGGESTKLKNNSASNLTKTKYKSCNDVSSNCTSCGSDMQTDTISEEATYEEFQCLRNLFISSKRYSNDSDLFQDEKSSKGISFKTEEGYSEDSEQTSNLPEEKVLMRYETGKMPNEYLKESAHGNYPLDKGTEATEEIKYEKLKFMQNLSLSCKTCSSDSVLLQDEKSPNVTSFTNEKGHSEDLGQTSNLIVGKVLMKCCVSKIQTEILIYSSVVLKGSFSEEAKYDGFLCWGDQVLPYKKYSSSSDLLQDEKSTKVVSFKTEKEYSEDSGMTNNLSERKVLINSKDSKMQKNYSKDSSDIQKGRFSEEANYEEFQCLRNQFLSCKTYSDDSELLQDEKSPNTISFKTEKGYSHTHTDDLGQTSNLCEGKPSIKCEDPKMQKKYLMEFAHGNYPIEKEIYLESKNETEIREDFQGTHADEKENYFLKSGNSKVKIDYSSDETSKYGDLNDDSLLNILYSVFEFITKIDKTASSRIEKPNLFSEAIFESQDIQSEPYCAKSVCILLQFLDQVKKGLQAKKDTANKLKLDFEANVKELNSYNLLNNENGKELKKIANNHLGRCNEVCEGIEKDIKECELHSEYLKNLLDIFQEKCCFISKPDEVTT